MFLTKKLCLVFKKGLVKQVYMERKSVDASAVDSNSNLTPLIQLMLFVMAPSSVSEVL